MFAHSLCSSATAASRQTGSAQKLKQRVKNTGRTAKVRKQAHEGPTPFIPEVTSLFKAWHDVYARMHDCILFQSSSSSTNSMSLALKCAVCLLTLSVFTFY